MGAYRREIDRYCNDPENYVFNPEELKELCKVSHRPYTTGFYFGRPSSDGQVYDTSSYIRDYELIGIVKECDGERITLSQRNRFFEGDELEIIQPHKPYVTIVAQNMKNEKGESVTVANHAEEIITMDCKEPIASGAMIRKRRA